MGAFELNALIILQLLGWVYLPVFIACGVSTLPEYMTKRFGGKRIRIYLAILSLLLYIFTKISVDLFAGAIFIRTALGWNLYLSIFLLLVLTVVCVMTGGLTAVIYTEVIQCFIMVIGSAILMVMSLVKIGGFSSLYSKYMRAMPNTTYFPSSNSSAVCGKPLPDAWIMLRGADDPVMPWPAFLLGQVPAAMWYWCADQMIVQRALSARSLSHAQGGTTLAGYIKILPVFLLVIPGMISRVLFPDEVGCADPDICAAVCDNRAGCSNIAYPKLVMAIMPEGLRGIMMAVMMAALMSDMASIFNSASTLFTMDIYPYIRKKYTVKELLITGRCFVLIMFIIGILWIPVVQNVQGGQLFVYIQAVSAYLAPPVAAVYCVAILWKRGNEKGAFTGLIFGLVIGVIRMATDFFNPEPPCGEPDLRPGIVKNFQYMYFATLSFWTTMLVMVVVSLLTLPPSDEMLNRTTYWTRFDKKITAGESIECTADGVIGNQEYINLDERKSDGSSAIDNSVKQQETENVSIVPKPVSKKSFFHKLLIWYCGFSESEQEEIKINEHRHHLEMISSLEQDPCAKAFLKANLVIVLLAAVFLYTFFSWNF
ncbi:sodium/myo-inositol cotransporter isoform X2 [Lingula anatina]|nr:sodium/myo-inositol cotransporter isoform X2 [Lingula anatina]|eukprot:XP_013406675.1 sodium/myo-inositol cotransporter isoform X2 [Lingula anatina]